MLWLGLLAKIGICLCSAACKMSFVGLRIFPHLIIEFIDYLDYGPAE